jgi:hypothetical protein
VSIIMLRGTIVSVFACCSYENEEFWFFHSLILHFFLAYSKTNIGIFHLLVKLSKMASRLWDLVLCQFLCMNF